MRVSTPNILYGISHPLRALRYLRYRDAIPYPQIAPYLPSAPVILEAGAANGDNTFEMAEFWPRATLHAFEPVPAACAALRNRAACLGSRVQVYPMAVGDQNGVMSMHISGQGTATDSQSSSILAPSEQIKEYDFLHFAQTTEIQVTTIDEWAATHGVSAVDFLWLDLQGYELHALRGADHLLKSVSAIHVEVSNVSLYQGSPLYPEVRSFLCQRGFTVAVEAIFRIGGNVLFVKRGNS